MAAIGFVGGICTGHACFFPRNNTGPGAPNVLVNGIPAHCIGDFYIPHGCGKFWHPGSLGSGAATVHAMGRPVGIIGDVVVCGSVVAIGSGNVFAGF